MQVCVPAPSSRAPEGRPGMPGPARQRPVACRRVNLLYSAAACLVAAQILGIYGLRTRKADLIFSVVMVFLVLAAVVLGVMGARRQLG